MKIPNSYKTNKNNLENKIVFITGATSGIGKALALELSKMGVKLILHGRNKSKLDSLYKEIKNIGYEPTIVTLDLENSKADDYKNFIKLIESKYQKIDGLVHNAAILGDRSPIEHYDIGLWQKVLHVNLTAPFILNRCLLPFLKHHQQRL